ncbi:MAG: hypothetical protein K2M87_01220 [Muribaculaceae bacterium]|nr:hypothetical protein [Muribaculaceae bacterium]
MIDINVDHERLDALFRAMTPRERARGMRSVIRKCATQLKARAGEILVSKVNTRDRSALKKTIWTKVYDRSIIGFRVTVAGNNHLYPSRMKNSRGDVRELPLGRWLESGTADRTTSRRGGRGALPAIGFMKQANDEMEAGMTARIEENFTTVMTRIAKKYGCI